MPEGTINHAAETIALREQFRSKYHDNIAKVVAAAPPASDDLRSRVATLLRPRDSK